MNLLDAHYNAPMITYDYQKLEPLAFPDEMFLVSRDFTTAVMAVLRGAYIEKKSTIDDRFAFGFSASRRQQFSYIYELKGGTRQSIVLAYAPQSLNFKYRILPNDENILMNIYELIERKLKGFTLNERVVLISKDEEWDKVLYERYSGCPQKVFDEYICTHRHKYEITFDLQFLSNKFSVVSDPIEKDVYIFYGGEVCLVISPGWARCVPVIAKNNYNLTRYNSFELREAFANLLVKILNNR